MILYRLFGITGVVARVGIKKALHLSAFNIESVGIKLSDSAENELVGLGDDTMGTTR